jgi:hypothetical protein
MDTGTRHVGGYLRDAFSDWIDAGRPDKVENVGDKEEIWESTRLLLELQECGDIMPGDLCGQLGLPPGSTYGTAVASIRGEHGPWEENQ